MALLDHVLPECLGSEEVQAGTSDLELKHRHKVNDRDDADDIVLTGCSYPYPISLPMSLLTRTLRGTV